MFAVGVFFSPVILGVYWTGMDGYKAHIAQHLQDPEYTIFRISTNYSLRGAVYNYLRKYLRRWLYGGSRLIKHIFTRPKLGHSTITPVATEVVDTVQLLPDDVLYLIAGCDWRVYGAMLTVNKTLNAMLRSYDTWGNFVEMIDWRRVGDNGSTTTTCEKSALILVGTKSFNATGDPTGTYHGESIESTIYDRPRGNWSKTSVCSHFRFGKLHRTEIYLYTREGVDKSTLQVRKLSERIYIPATAANKHSYKIAYEYGYSGDVTKVKATYYRDGRVYSPSDEALGAAIIYLVCASATCVLGYTVCKDWRLIRGAIGAVLRRLI
ncbi:hypothetical protein F-E9_502 [Faustovirus]|nr:hypothetical protein F-E9_502 [Faustovirus]